jgi:hypothetical protein
MISDTCRQVGACRKAVRSITCTGEKARMPRNHIASSYAAAGHWRQGWPSRLVRRRWVCGGQTNMTARIVRPIPRRALSRVEAYKHKSRGGGDDDDGDESGVSG